MAPPAASRRGGWLPGDCSRHARVRAQRSPTSGNRVRQSNDRRGSNRRSRRARRRTSGVRGARLRRSSRLGCCASRTGTRSGRGFARGAVRRGLREGQEEDHGRRIETQASPPERAETERDLRGDRQEPLPASALLPKDWSGGGRARQQPSTLLETHLLGAECARKLARLQELPGGRHRLPRRVGRSKGAATVAMAQRRRPRLPSG